VRAKKIEVPPGEEERVKGGGGGRLRTKKVGSIQSTQKKKAYYTACMQRSTPNRIDEEGNHEEMKFFNVFDDAIAIPLFE